LRITENNNFQKIGKYSIRPDGLEFGRQAIKQSRIEKNFVTIVDEVGRLELKDGGWADEIEKLTKQAGVILIMAVRDEFVESLMGKWNITEYSAYRVSTIDLIEFCNTIVKG
jgi:nucleoside-triphosphatase THEP1